MLPLRARMGIIVYLRSINWALVRRHENLRSPLMPQW